MLLSPHLPLLVFYDYILQNICVTEQQMPGRNKTYVDICW